MRVRLRWDRVSGRLVVCVDQGVCIDPRLDWGIRGDGWMMVDSGCPPVGNMQVPKTSRERGWRLPEETLKLGVGEEISVTRGSHFAHA